MNLANVRREDAVHVDKVRTRISYFKLPRRYCKSANAKTNGCLPQSRKVISVTVERLQLRFFHQEFCLLQMDAALRLTRTH